MLGCARSAILLPLRPPPKRRSHAVEDFVLIRNHAAVLSRGAGRTRREGPVTNIPTSSTIHQTVTDRRYVSDVHSPRPPRLRVNLAPFSTAWRRLRCGVTHVAIDVVEESVGADLENKSQTARHGQDEQDLQDGAELPGTHRSCPKLTFKSSLPPWYHHLDVSRAEVHKWPDLRPVKPVTGLNLVSNDADLKRVPRLKIVDWRAGQ